jgi:hypothetical protein
MVGSPESREIYNLVPSGGFHWAHLIVPVKEIIRVLGGMHKECL